MRFLKALKASLDSCAPLPRILVSCPTAKMDKLPAGGKLLTDTDLPTCNSLLLRV